MRMFIIFLSLFLIPAHLSNFAHAAPSATVQSDSFGLGLMIGSMTAVTGKYWVSTNGAVDFGLGVGGFSASRGTAIYADYLWHIPGVFGSGTRFGRESSLYLGGGGGIGFWDDSYECGRWDCSRRTRNSGTGIFLRGLAGVEWYPAPTRFGVFGEVGPTLLFAPVGGSTLDISIGGRYYF